MNGQERERHHLVEHILSLAGLLRENHLEMDALSRPGMEALLPDTPQLRAALEFVRFMDEMPGGFLIYSAQGGQQIIYANRGLLQIFRCSSLRQFQDLTGNSFRGLVHPEDLEEVERSIARQIASSQAEQDYVEYRIIRQDGSTGWIEDYGHFVHSAQAGGVFYVFLGDATEKHTRMLSQRAELDQEHLRRLEVIEGLSVNYESILYADLDRDQLLPYRLSPRGEAVSGERLHPQALHDFFDRYISAWVYPEDRKLLREETSPSHIRQRLSNSSTYYQNYRVVEQGRTRYLQLRVVNVGHTDHVSQVVMGYRRVDEEMQREVAQKQLLSDALNNANLAIAAREAFLSNMSHDMRTPLNAIFGFTALARKHLQGGGGVLRDLEQIESASRQLLELIDKVLQLSWSDSHVSSVAESECSLTEIVEEVCGFLRPQAQEKNITFLVDCSGVAHPTAYADPDKLRQLLMYLVNNAVTYTKPGGRVCVTASEQADPSSQYALYHLTVEDTGVGISQEFLGQIFEPFSREQNTTLSGIHGIGLGLSIARNIVELIGGSIDVHSEVGRGSTFVVTLRLRTQSRLLSHPPAAVPVQPVCRSILLVEDNEINREIETELLEEQGFAIETAEDGRIALEMVAASAPGQFDLILMDLQMPVMDGWQAAQAIRALPDPLVAGVPIFALSANVFPSDIQRSLDCGMNAHLKKPLDIPALLEAIGKVFPEPPRL